MDQVPLHEALRDREKVLRAFLDDDGRIVAMPAKHRKRLVVLDHVVRAFAPGQKYTEYEVNVVLRAFCDDYVTVRRYLVDAGFMDRDQGVYWRTGGTVEV